MKNHSINDHARLMGKRGGDKTKATQDPEYYRRIGRRGALKRWKKPRPLPEPTH